jgi:1-acyl-sn-glycerol-3-phosphate acyltransferase
VLPPAVNLAWATAYTIRMSQIAMWRHSRGDSDEVVANLTKQWARGLSRRMNIEVEWHGVDAIDWSKPCVIMANHQSYLDVLALYRALPRPFGFLAKKELYNIPYFNGVMRALGCVPVDRQNHEKAVASVENSARIVRAGSTIAVFPEGTRGPGDRILPLKKGPFYLTQEAQVPTVPIGLRGTGTLMPRRNTGIRPGLLEVYVGEPIPPPPPGDAQARKALMARVRSELSRLAALPEID